MKKNLLTVALIAASMTTYAQVGIGTTMPATGTILHIDGAKDNTTATPTVSQVKNDFVVLANGNVGIGTDNPLVKMQLLNNNITPVNGLGIFSISGFDASTVDNNSLSSTFNLNGTAASSATKRNGYLGTAVYGSGNHYNVEGITSDIYVGLLHYNDDGTTTIADTYSGTINFANVSRNGLNVSSGVVVNAEGNYTTVLASGSGVIRNARAFRALAKAVGSDAGNNHTAIAYGIYGGEVIASGGDNNYAYGLKIDGGAVSVSGAGKSYAIAVDETSDSYFMGNVGIGTPSPTAKLHVGGTAGTDGIKFPDGTLQTTAFTTTGAAASKFTNDATNTLVKLTNLSDGTTARTSGTQFAVLDNGNVGIGTTSPTNTLEVNKLGAHIVANGLAGTSFITSQSDLNPQVRTFDNTNGTIAKLQSIDNEGIVGTESNHHFSIRTNNLERIYISNTGNVGIGIGATVATAKLEVNGKIKIGDDADAPEVGMIRFDGTHFQGYNGSAWVQLDNL